MSSENLARIREIEEINIKLNTVTEEINCKLEKDKNDLRLRSSFSVLNLGSCPI